jgi:subtilisin family serine protease
MCKLTFCYTATIDGVSSRPQVALSAAKGLTTIPESTAMNLRHLLSRVAAGTLIAACTLGVAHAGGGGKGGGGGGGGGTDPALPGEVLVKLRSTSALQPLLARQSLSLVSRFGARPIYRLQVVGSAAVQDVLARLALEPDVMIAEPNFIHRSPEARGNIAWAIGNPGAYAAQWAPQAMKLTQAQALSRGAGVRVAVLDTGIDANHPLLASRLLPGKDFVDDDNDPSEVFSPTSGAFGHGTHVAGLVAMVAPDARIMPLRVLDTEGNGNAWVLAEAILHALDPDGNPATDDGAHVINLSLGSLSRTRIIDTIAQIAGCAAAVPDDPIADRSDPGYRSDDERCAVSLGAVIVAAAGNDSSASVKEYPAAEGAYGLLSVAASSNKNRLAGFSNSGSWVDMAAPGEGITSTFPGGLYATWSGTSMASPLAAGTAALVLSANPGMAPKDVARRLKRTASVMCGTFLRQVDAYAALANIEPLSSSCR